MVVKSKINTGASTICKKRCHRSAARADPTRFMAEPLTTMWYRSDTHCGWSGQFGLWPMIGVYFARWESSLSSQQF